MYYVIKTFQYLSYFAEIQNRKCLDGVNYQVELRFSYYPRVNVAFIPGRIFLIRCGVY